MKRQRIKRNNQQLKSFVFIQNFYAMFVAHLKNTINKKLKREINYE